MSTEVSTAAEVYTLLPQIIITAEEERLITLLFLPSFPFFPQRETKSPLVAVS